VVGFGFSILAIFGNFGDFGNLSDLRSISVNLRLNLHVFRLFLKIHPANVAQRQLQVSLPICGYPR
jgi:hypothetical protein